MADYKTNYHFGTGAVIETVQSTNGVSPEEFVKSHLCKKFVVLSYLDGSYGVVNLENVDFIEFFPVEAEVEND